MIPMKPTSATPTLSLKEYCNHPLASHPTSQLSGAADKLLSQRTEKPPPRPHYTSHYTQYIPSHQSVSQSLLPPNNLLPHHVHLSNRAWSPQGYTVLVSGLCSVGLRGAIYPPRFPRSRNCRVRNRLESHRCRGNIMRGDGQSLLVLPYPITRVERAYLMAGYGRLEHMYRTRWGHVLPGTLLFETLFKTHN